jgi:aldehyde dehydrogenase (NAD+)
MGAMINAKQRARVEGFLERAREQGRRVLAQGAIDVDAPDGGFYVTPTLFGEVPRDDALANEEVFGPVLSLMPFDDEADAVALANGTPYGLVAGVWTRDARRSIRVARAMRCGQVFVNGYGAGGGVELPFGGVKKSGHGREKGFEALYEFCAAKTIVINQG